MTSRDVNPWQMAQERLQYVLDEHSYKNWFSQTRFESFEDGCLTVGVPSQFFADWLRNHYLDAIQDCARELVPGFEEVRFLAASESAAPPPVTGGNGPAERPKRARRASQRDDHFNPRYVFARFVVGAGNRFAHAAAKAVAESPARAYNPLFLYGGTGLGKTHLMQAVGQEIIDRRPDANIVFISSEQFTNQLIESIAKKSTMRFRAKYRKVDVLLIDDIHFIAGKEATQEEFFHTFNALFDKHKQIVISSDRQPKDIKGLEERLISRFEWGLVTDIQPPDLETRVAILQNKAAEENLTVPPEVLRYIATHITTNIRELEGALITVLAYSKLTEHKIGLPLAEEVLRDLIGRDKIQPVSIEAVQRAVAEHFDVRISDLRGRSRQRQVAFPRQVAMFLAKQLIPSLSLNEIGEAFGGKDHTTVIYACQKIGQESKDNRDTRQLLSHLERALRS
ncbi:MAG: chromosomal replication initiator protein DnaA [Candidatus Hydrogenedentes bacterium]|nr:chromosomal replication initiator protein DnaA [Candidatus Hydrogenedentota bacterium]